MHYVHLGFDRNIRLLIPSAWNAFVYRGFVYRQHESLATRSWMEERLKVIDLKRFTLLSA